jgi:hypothetical protein
MMNLDDTLRNAASASKSWSSRDAHKVASGLAHDSGGEVDWDEDAGEDWLRVVDGANLVALVSVMLPLVFLRNDFNRPRTSIANVLTVPVDDFDTAEFKCSLGSLNEAFGLSDRLSSLDLGGFSVNDLWYATV